MNTLEHLLVTLSEECMEAMEALYTDTEGCDIAVELRDIVAVADLINQSGGLGVSLPLAIGGHRVYFKDDDATIESDLHKVLLKIQYYASKSLRFGISDIKPGSDKSNEQEIEVLMMEYAYSIQVLAYKNPSINYEVIYDADGIAAKQKKVLANMVFAMQQGTLQFGDTIRQASSSPAETIAMIKGLCADEASLINHLFYQSEALGLAALDNALSSLEAFLKQSNPMFVRGMSIEYRTFVVELLMLIDTPYRGIATSKILMS